MKILEHCYKLSMLLGSISSDNLRAQTLVGDKHGVKLIINLVKTEMQSDSLVKWGLWSLFNITYNHPPNKADLFQHSGLNIILDALSTYPQNIDIITQALALLLSFISDDSQAKFSVSKARHAALQMGIGDRLEAIKEWFKKEQHIVGCIQAIMNLLMKNFS